VKTTFKDVAGLEGPKKIQEIVEFLKTQKYTNLGGKIQRELYLWVLLEQGRLY
jgi:ATP-dependent Zn protease